MPDYFRDLEIDPDRPNDLQVRIKFNDKATRRAFMLKAAQDRSFPFHFENYDSVLVAPDQAMRLQPLAQEFGGDFDLVVKTDHSKLKGLPSAPTHEDRVDSWNRLMVKIDQELSTGPA